MIKRIGMLSALVVSVTLSQEISFEGLVEQVNLFSPKIEQQRVNTELSKVKLEIAKSQYYPTFSLGSSTEYSNKFNKNLIPSSVGDNSLAQTTQYQTSTVLAINYDLYRFGATSLHVEAAKKEIDFSKANECIISEQILIELLETYQRVRIAGIKLDYYEK